MHGLLNTKIREELLWQSAYWYGCSGCCKRRLRPGATVSTCNKDTKFLRLSTTLSSSPPPLPPFFWQLNWSWQNDIILVNNQLDALFSMYLFISLFYMFRATQCSSSGESNDFMVCRSLRTGIPWSHLNRVIHTRWCMIQFDSPDDEHWVARNM